MQYVYVLVYSEIFLEFVIKIYRHLWDNKNFMFTHVGTKPLTGNVAQI